MISLGLAVCAITSIVTPMVAFVLFEGRGRVLRGKKAYNSAKAWHPGCGEAMPT